MRSIRFHLDGFENLWITCCKIVFEKSSVAGIGSHSSYPLKKPLLAIK